MADRGAQYAVGNVVIDELHARIHQGRMYSASYIDTVFANAEVVDIVLVVTTPAHLQFSVGAGADALSQLYQTPSYSGGTPSTISNHNRFAGDDSDMSVLGAATVTDPGTFIEDWVTHGGAGGRALGGLVGTFNEWILAPGTYLLRITNLTTTSNVLHAHFSWYHP